MRAEALSGSSSMARCCGVLPSFDRLRQQTFVVKWGASMGFPKNNCIIPHAACWTRPENPEQMKHGDCYGLDFVSSPVFFLFDAFLKPSSLNKLA